MKVRMNIDVTQRALTQQAHEDWYIALADDIVDIDIDAHGNITRIDEVQAVTPIDGRTTINNQKTYTVL